VRYRWTEEELKAGARARTPLVSSGWRAASNRLSTSSTWFCARHHGAAQGALDPGALSRAGPRYLEDGGPSARRRGLTALFAGPSGTGKTMAAEVLASELGLDLYTVDLATVVDKYVGETEKNLDRIFAEAERING